MCAIFGFISQRGRPIKLDAIKRIVEANIVRGPHAFGFSWLDSRGVLRAYKHSGRLDHRFSCLSLAREARMLIGHLRFATHGEPEENINNHPHPSDGGWIVHNGVVRNHCDLIKDYDLHLTSECDSETLALLIEQLDGTRMQRLTGAVNDSAGNLAMMGLWSRPATLVAARRGNPLHIGSTSDGLYLATLRNGLPGKVVEVRDNSAVQFTFESGKDAGKIASRVMKLASKGMQAGALFDERGAYRGG